MGRAGAANPRKHQFGQNATFSRRRVPGGWGFNPAHEQ
jgi:hypothetical protein